MSKMVKAITWFYFLVCLLLVLLKAHGSFVDLTRVYTAVAKGAVCLDGSPPAYHFDSGTGEGINNWLVYLEGGGWCNSAEDCSNRAHTHFGSSHKMEKASFSGILDNGRESNPNFYHWNRIVIRYCDGSSFTGDVEQVDPVYHVHFRGARVFDAIMEDLLERGMKNASNALLTGCSAGGLASILNCDKFRALLPTKARVKCMSDGGFFLYARDFFGGYHFETHIFDEVVSVHGSAKNLPRSCTSTLKPGLCFYPQNVVPYIQTPLFILNSVFDTWQLQFVFALTYLPEGQSWVECQYNVSYCSSSQIKKLQGLRSEFLHTILNGLDNHSSRGLFMDSCYAHCQTLFGPKWQGTNVKLNDKTISDAVGDWFYDKGVVQLVDYKSDMPRWCVYDPGEPNPNNNYTWPL
ncbi:hypothetical protein LguiA_022350 [Lonicera macranthoides]